MAITDVAVVRQTNVDWAAILAGAAMTTAVALVLLAFGSALGLSVTSPYEGEGLSPIAFAVAAGLWLLWVQLLSFYVGGYVAARLRPRAAGVSEHEVDVRDGLHGLLVWAVGVIAAAVITFAGVGGVTAAVRTAQSPTDLAASAASAAGEEINDSAAQESGATEQANASPASDRRAEVARKLTVVSAFITAASMLAGAVAAFFGAEAGGNHRDRNTVGELFAFRRTTVSR